MHVKAQTRLKKQPREVKQRNAETRAVVAALKAAFPRAEVDAYRYAIGSIRVRIIDASFRGKRWSERHDHMVGPVLDKLPLSTQSDIIVLVMLTPAEHRAGGWGDDYEFDHPLPLSEL